MKAERFQLPVVALVIAVFAMSLLPAPAAAQGCQTADDLDAAVKTAITASAQRYFDMAVKGDVAALRQNSIASLAAGFGDVEARVKDHQADLDGAQGTARSMFLLDASGEAPIPHAEFYCGVFGKEGQTAHSAVFYFENLPAAEYAVVLFEADSSKARMTVSEILQRAGTDWKLADLFIKPPRVAGHDSDWFLAKAREYKAKGQMHNAWFYFLEARSLVSPLPTMSTLASEKLYSESQGMLPADLPAKGKTADLVAGTTTYKLTAVYPEGVGSDLDLIVKYQTADASNANKSYQENVTVMKALVAKYPELKEAFAALVGRAVDASGRDYGTLLAMKDIK
jgi:hypothetical protein